MHSRQTSRLLVVLAVLALAIAVPTAVLRSRIAARPDGAGKSSDPAVATAGTGPSSTTSPDTQALPTNTITDSFGRTVTVTAKPTRIVSLAPAHTEILFALGCAEQVAGVTGYCDYPAEAKQKTQIGGFSDPSVEMIVSLKPDLVLADSIHKTVVEQLESLKIPVLALVAETVHETPGLIELIGSACGRTQEGRTLADNLRRDMESIRAKTRGIDDKLRPRVYYELWHDPIMSVGPGDYLHDLITLAGGVNIMADAKSNYPIASVEAILKSDPEIIIYCHGQQNKEDIAGRPGWDEVTAVKKGDILLFPDEDIFMRSGPRIAQALQELARVLHPQLFK